MPRRSALIVLISLFALVVPLSAVSAGPPSNSGIVERFNDNGFGLIPFEDDGVWVLGNFNSLADLCNGEDPVNDDAIQLVHLPNGVTVVKVNPGVVPIVVFPMLSDDPFADACQHQDDAIAMGSANVLVNDNDGEGISDTRTNVWGERGNGSATDADGNNYSVHWHVKFQYIPKNDAFRVVSEGSSFRQLPN